MLEPGKIPVTEPLLRVGLVLPEDQMTSLTIANQSGTDYQIEFSGKTLPFPAGQRLFLKFEPERSLLRLNDEDFHPRNLIKIYPVIERRGLNPGQGLLLKNMIAGRDFHWKKYIDITVAGAVHINRLDDRFIVINELPFEDYLACVATSEMGAACPQALLEAQTIAARSWMLANVEQKHIHLGMDVCNDDCCQRYQGTTFLSRPSAAAALNTAGSVIMFGEQVADARYSKSCGGVTESYEKVWPGQAVPYLSHFADWDKKQTLPDLSIEENAEQWINDQPEAFCSPHTVDEKTLKKYLGSVDEDGAYYRWTVTLKQTEVCQQFSKANHVSAARINGLRILERGHSGRVIRLAVSWMDSTGKSQNSILCSEYNIRHSLSKNFLYSSAFIIARANESEFILHGAGWGHGVGLCQIGALGMALKGYTSEQIIAHYFPGTRLTQIYKVS